MTPKTDNMHDKAKVISLHPKKKNGALSPSKRLKSPQNLTVVLVGCLSCIEPGVPQECWITTGQTGSSLSAATRRGRAGRLILVFSIKHKKGISLIR
jgi:hypothetical protein